MLVMCRFDVFPISGGSVVVAVAYVVVVGGGIVIVLLKSQTKQSPVHLIDSDKKQKQMALHYS